MVFCTDMFGPTGPCIGLDEVDSGLDGDPDLPHPAQGAQVLGGV